MNSKTDKQELVSNEKLMKDLGKAIESVDAKLMDITGGLEAPIDLNSVTICNSKCG